MCMDIARAWVLALVGSMAAAGRVEGRRKEMMTEVCERARESG
jgi:hypothetical protein